MPKIDRSLDETVEDEIREEKKQRKGKKRITHDDVLEQQFNALVSKQENMALKKKKIRIGDICLGAESVARGHHYPH